jgi:HD-like signal output (HDOD) protein
MEPRTFELCIDSAGVAGPGKGVLCAFVPPSEDEMHATPVVAIACDPRHDPGRPINELAPAVLAYMHLALGNDANEAQWAAVDNYGRFFEIIPNWQTSPPMLRLEKFPDGGSVEAYFRIAGGAGEAAIELLSAMLEAPRDFDTTPTEEDFLGAIEAHSNLPAPGAIFQKVDAAAHDGDANKVAAAIQIDPVLSSSLINSANAARFGGGTKTGSVPQAVLRLGTGFVRRIVFVAEMMARYQKGACKSFDYHGYWMYTVANGAAMRALITDFGIPERMADEAFTAGLVSGIGWLAMAETFPDLMARYIERCQGADPVTKARAYREIFPCPANLVSERYLERFSFPEIIRQALIGQPLDCRSWFDCLARAARVANSLSPFICNPVPNTVPVPEACQEEWQRWRSLLSGV